ncbi:MAG: hypothetical protein HY847_06685 [Betaproteobacteria bacterium]|nr:hypothetical protein [Betaproteobacteria bacterium]
MPNHEVRWGLWLALLLCVFSGAVLADEDWLITRVNGAWTWEKTGPEGRVLKNFLNQEVLRLGEDGQVIAVSALPFTPGETTTCSETARRNPKHACSSAFLDCKAAGGGVFSVMLGFVLDGGKGASEARNAFSCTFNEQALQEAAVAVGLIDKLAPKKAQKRAETEANTAPPVTD